MPLSTVPHTSREPVGQLYGDHHRWLVSWLRARLGCSQQAAELAQDTFVRLLLAERTQPVAAELKEPRHFLVTVAKRVMIDSFATKPLSKHTSRPWPNNRRALPFRRKVPTPPAPPALRPSCRCPCAKRRSRSA
ncbi:sigma factor [Pseudomonas sp. BIGb0164]|uniref:sigma factor n=1 Tax=Pseudomonas sp. BIGb0164 TaxID=2940605 RepID=UPI00286E4958|nr:sigma factor [Pseudomonas sp. BIGb0164]